MIPASSIDPTKIETLDRNKIRQVKQATRDKQTCAMLLYLVFVTAPVTLPLFIRAIRKERRLVREISAHLGVNPAIDYKVLRDLVADVINDPELERRAW